MTINRDISQKQIPVSTQEKRALLAELVQKQARLTKSFHPLSYNQQSLWFLYQTAPESSAYNTALAVRIHSEVDVKALKTTFQTLVARHPSLRTNFVIKDGQPYQEINGYQEVCFEQIDASNWTSESLNKKVIEASQRPFDLSQEPLFRVNLFTCSQQEHILLLTIHHIVSDGWSLWTLLSELRVLYPAYKAGEKVSLPPVNFLYSDYVDWQSSMLASPQGKKLSQYWQQQLSGSSPLNLPTDRPRPPIQNYRGASCPFRINRELAQKLKKLAQAEKTTLYSVLLAAFQVLLHRYTSQEDIAIGSPTAGRNHQEFHNIVGYCANPIVLRANTQGNPTFKEFLNQIRQTVSEAIAHQDYPFSLLVKQLQPKRDASRSPLFQTMFVLQQPHLKEIAQLLTPSETRNIVNWGGLELEFFELITEEGQFDLTLEMLEADESLFALFKYNTDLFDAPTMTRMSEHFENLLSAIVTNPEQNIQNLPILGAEEQHQLLVEWSGTHAKYPQYECLHQLFEKQVEKNHDAVAVVFEGQQLTYGELNALSNKIAHHLQQLGVKPEVKVGICLERSLDVVTAILGILKAGGAYVPLDPTYPQQRLDFMLNDSQVPVVLTKQKFVEKIPQNSARIVCLDTDWEVISDSSESNPVSQVKPDNLAYTIYTSGSTGQPKGVLVNHENVGRLFAATQCWYNFCETDVWTLFHSYAFDFSVWEIWGALLHGGRLVVVPYEITRSPEDFYRLLTREKVTILNQTPSAFRQLIHHELVNPVKELNLRLVIFGGEALEIHTLKPWFERHGDSSPELINMYGITETTVHVTYRALTIADLNSNSSLIGRPIPDLQVYILDSHMQPVPIGVPGEMYISGAGLTRGYLNRPSLCSQRFIPNPFSNNPQDRLYKSGDLAKYLPNGEIEYLGRIDNQVQIRGFRIEIGEIQSMLVQHPEVREATIAVQEDTLGDKVLVAYVVLDSESVFTPTELRSFLQKYLPDYMLPSAFVILDAFPLTHNGKIDYKDLSTLEAFINQKVDLIPPRDSLEQQLVQIWEKVLNVNPIGVRDNFFDLGGHSILAVHLMSEIQQVFGKNLPLATLLSGATIENLATILRQNTDTVAWSPLVEIQPNGSKPPFFCFPGAGGNVIYLYDLARKLGYDQPFYGLQAKGLDGESLPYSRIEDIASSYIEIIQKVQPLGPYFLGGHSSGGLVAFEVAQQLQKQGHEVAKVVIVDIEAPVAECHEITDDWDDAKWLIRICSLIERFVGKNLEISYDMLRSLESDRQFDYIGQQLKMIDLLPPEAGIKQVRGILQVFKANYQAAANYLPTQVHPTAIALFKARDVNDYDSPTEELKAIQQSPTWGWNQFSDKTVDVHAIPGDHITMMAEPNVQVLAEKLKIYLA